MTDLDKLIEAVEAGSIGWYDFPEVCEAIWGDGEDCPNHMETIRAAYQGNLNAAKRLHDVLLPGWMWNVVDDETTVWPKYPGDPKDYQEGFCEDNPARAWLLAVLKALRANHDHVR